MERVTGMETPSERVERFEARAEYALSITEQMEVAKRAEETLANIYRRNGFSYKPPRISQGTVKVILEIASDVAERRATSEQP